MDNGKIKIKTQLSQNELNIVLTWHKTNQQQRFTINSLDTIQGLSQWFDSLQQVQKYVQDQNNIAIKNSNTLQIIHKPPTKKQGYVVIAELKSTEPINHHQKVYDKLAIYKKFTKPQKQTEQKQPQRPKCAGQLWVDPTIDDYWRLNFNDKWIQNRYGVARILGRRVLKGNKDSFTIYVYNIVNGISVGIIDKRIKCLMPGKRNQISYQSNKYYWTGAETLQNQGQGYQAKSPLTVQLDFNQKMVCWRVGGEIRYEAGSDLLSDRSIEWVPFVFLGDGGDSFEVTQ